MRDKALRDYAIGILIGAVITIVVAANARRHETASTHCASLDAIAVQTPDGWTCITTAVIPADGGTAHIGYDAHTGSKQ